MEQSFDRFNAALLYCNQCRKPMPVRERLLLVLPDGELYDYRCEGCNSSVGTKTERGGLKQKIMKGSFGG
jgi:hypothetical protein